MPPLITPGHKREVGKDNEKWGQKGVWPTVEEVASGVKLMLLLQFSTKSKGSKREPTPTTIDDILLV